MARRTRIRRSGMFLLELMIAILFFSVASAVCAQVFVKARLMSDTAGQLSDGVSLCTNAAEMIRSADSPREAEDLLLARFPGLSREENRLFGQEEGYDFSVETRTEGDLWSYALCCLDPAGETVYRLCLDRYFPEVQP